MAGQLEHERWMSRALELAARADFGTSPNPMVGAVIVDHAGNVVGEGFHLRAGEPHAEVAALQAAGERARGATMYVSLEPHSFKGAHTSPCTDAIINAGIRTVVVAMVDPDARARARGLDSLTASGVEVITGVLEDRAMELNAFYVKQRTTGRPFVTLKWAMSLDGRTTTASGDSRWISGPEAREHAHTLRHAHDAILVGVNTVLADDPRLTTRLENKSHARNPARVVLDRSLRTPPAAAVLPATIFCEPEPDVGRRQALENAGAEVLAVGTAPEIVLDTLGSRGILSLLVEGGATVHASFAAHADRVAAYVAPRLIVGAERMPQALQLGELTTRRLGPDILIEADVHRDS
ncbi:MAG TPA: bifunctional diaminohydroxyphosphoribosylaminopyrimidine deaminase/5-amino-6-(5-phosphoribosylamino)uracil reductase RibD [Candidatus Dormibacteraeota bacterium]